MLSTISRRRFEAQRERLVKELEEDINPRLAAAKALGDTSENTEYETAVSDAIKCRLSIEKIEEKLSASTDVIPYGTTIGVGSFITIKYEYEDGSIEDLGLYLFDAVGDRLTNTISDKSDLGHKIQGTTGGIFPIRIDGGKIIKAHVTLESESKIQEYLSMFPIEGVDLQKLLD